MKKTYILLLLLFIGTGFTVRSQDVINPVNKLVQASYENKMFSYRLLMDYILVKNNVYQKKIINDIDKILARYDDNLLYIAKFAEKNKDTKKKFINLQLFWNDYRILFIDFDNTDLNKLIKYTDNFAKYNDELTLSVLETNKVKDKYKKQLETLDLLAVLNNQIDQLLINYFLKNHTKNQLYNVDTKAIQKTLKKLSKTETGKNNINIIEDLKNTISVIESLYSKENNSKQMYSNVNYFTKKTFILMKQILSNIKE